MSELVSHQEIELELSSAGAQFTPVELRLPENLAKEDWAHLGRKLARADQVMRWWLGDWAAFGVRKYGQLKEFAELNGIDYGTLRNLAWVCQSVELSRRRDNLDFGKHAEVAQLPPKEQAKWLDKIASEGLPRAEIRRQLRQAAGERNALDSDGPTTRFISRACDDLIHWIKTRPAGFWSEERKTAWKTRLEPLVRFWESL